MLGGFGGGGSGGGFGGFMGTLGGFGDKLGGLNEKLQAAKESIPIPGLEEQFQNYMEDELGAVKVHFGKISEHVETPKMPSCIKMAMVDMDNIPKECGGGFSA